jgi:hypothetical protein
MVLAREYVPRKARMMRGLVLEWSRAMYPHESERKGPVFHAYSEEGEGQSSSDSIWEHVSSTHSN